MRDLLIVPTGTANVASVAAAFGRLGVSTRLCGDARQVEQAASVVLPGVGAYAAAAARLDELDLRTVLRERIEAGRPTLAICLGMQLFASRSEESVDARGLQLFDAVIERFPRSARTPQLGWNRVTPVDSDLLQPGFAYFANSYRLQGMPAGWAGATTEHGGSFVSALQRGAVLACQFHPEISGAYGHDLLGRWLQRCEQEVAC